MQGLEIPRWLTTLSASLVAACTLDTYPNVPVPNAALVAPTPQLSDTTDVQAAKSTDTWLTSTAVAAMHDAGSGEQPHRSDAGAAATPEPPASAAAVVDAGLPPSDADASLPPASVDASTTPTGDAGPQSARCPSGDGFYCGQHMIAGEPNLLYSCLAGELAVSQRCEAGCDSAATGGADRCATAIPAPTPSCPHGDGLYCGSSVGQPGRHFLYRCSGGSFRLTEACEERCEQTDVPAQDRCSAPPECPATDGTYCGGHGVAGSNTVLMTCASGRIRAATQCQQSCERLEAPGQDHCAQPPQQPAGSPPPGAPGPGVPGMPPGPPPF